MFTLNIDTDAVVKFTAKLERMHKSALPVSIRGALNDAAFDVKTKTMPASSKQAFVNRSPNFFKANSKFEKAQGFNIKTMHSTVGMTPQGLKGTDNYAVQDLQEQESGGDIGHKALIPMNPARSGNSKNKLVRPNARLAQIRKAVNAKNMGGVRTKSQQFVKAVFKAGAGGTVIARNPKSGKEILWRVNSLSSSLKTKKFTLDITPLYTVKKGRSVHVHATHFMRKASLQSEKKMEHFFVLQAKRQFAKLR